MSKKLKVPIPKSLEDQATIFSYKRISFEKDWEIELDILPVKEIFQLAMNLAKVESNTAHARAIEVRMPELDESFRYKVGRLKNGCQTAQVTNCRSELPTFSSIETFR